MMGPVLEPTGYANIGAYFAFNVLPTIIFFSALSTLLYFLGVLQPIVKGLSWVMQRTMGTSGSETLSGVANIFLGQTEAPLFVRPFIATCTKSELMAIMVGGFSNIASGVLGAYVGMLAGFEPNIAGYLLSSSIISAPASLVVAKLLLPESEPSETMGTIKIHVDNSDANIVDATARGAIEGLQLALNVGAMQRRAGLDRPLGCHCHQSGMDAWPFTAADFGLHLFTCSVVTGYPMGTLL
jgi:CNT family concentrative nucleoside transporter